MDPLISIITVCFNSGEHIETTIKNVLGQSYPNIEYIVIDGGSTDNTVNILNKYSSKIKYWISEPDKGIYDAMNKGWAQASPQSYILYLGAGDTILNLCDINKLATADVLVGTVKIGDKYSFTPKPDFRLLIGNTLHHQAMLVKKSVHPSPPFNLKYKIYSDFDFNQRLLKAGYKFIIDDTFVGYALEGGVSAQFNKQEMLSIIKSNYGIFYKLLATIYYKLRHEI